jgi:hypothetical protein
MKSELGFKAAHPDSGWFKPFKPFNRWRSVQAVERLVPQAKTGDHIFFEQKIFGLSLLTTNKPRIIAL